MTKSLVKISKHNTKLGKILSFSLPTEKTCVNKTSWCEKHCYAKKSERQYPNVGKAYGINLEAIKDTGFVSSMIDEIKQNTKTNKVFRIHVSGDFFQVSYIYNWIKIAKACPDIMFYGYTRAWEHQDLIPHLGILNKLSNVILFASVDETTNKNTPHTFRVAYAGDNKPSNFKGIACPQQTNKVDFCSTCKLCFNKTIKTNIFFKTH